MVVKRTDLLKEGQELHSANSQFSMITERIDPVQGTVHHSNVERFPGLERAYMSNPIKDKATDWWKLISSKETADSYKNFFKLTWTILKETALMIWLLLCFVLVSIGWVWNNSSKVSESVSELRSKVDQKPDGNVMAEAAVRFWEASQTGASNALATARKQLNLPEQTPKAPKTVKAEPAQPETSKVDSEKSPASKTPEQYAQEQAAKDAAAKAKAEAAKATEEQASQAAAAQESEAATDTSGDA